GQAGVRADPFHAWIDNWTLRDDETSVLGRLTMQADTPTFGYDLRLVSTGPLVLHGDQGFSQKSGLGQASYYYSQPFYQVSGEVMQHGERHRVSGQAWLDREWSSQPLSA